MNHRRNVNREEPQQMMKISQVLLRLTQYLRPYKYPLVVGFVMMLGASFLRALPPMVIREALNPIQGDLDHIRSICDANFFLTIGIALLGVNLLAAIVGYAHRIAIAVPGQGMVRDIRVQLFKHLHALPLKFFDGRQSGELISRVLSDVDRLEWGVVDSFLQIVNGVFTFAWQIYLMMSINVPLTLIALAAVPLMAGGTIFFNKRLHGLFHTRRERMGDLTTVVQENISGIRVVKSFGREDHELGRFKREAEHYYNFGLRTNRMLAVAFNLMLVVGALAASILLAYGGSLVLDGTIKIGDLVAMMMFTGMLYAPIHGLVHANYHLQESGVSAARVFEILDTVPEIADPPDALPVPQVQGHVQFSGVHFSYNGKDPVLRDVNFEVKPGEMVAFVGKSGAGKSTIVNLIPRLYDVENGAVFIDGRDIRTLKNAELRKHIAMVMQDVFLFNGTIRENIAYGNLGATNEEIIAAARAAHVDEFVDDLPDGYETQIGERGIKMSGGQRQRLSVARAILADAPILVLDEPTSNVDTHSERLIQEALERLMMDRTTLVIAHRLSTVINAHKIILIDKGQIQAIGTHDELIETSPLYAHLYRIQLAEDDQE